MTSLPDRLLVDVTPTDIAGASFGVRNCPIARALKRMYPIHHWVVSELTVLCENCEPSRYLPSNGARRYMRRYDTDHAPYVQPARFIFKRMP